MILQETKRFLELYADQKLCTKLQNRKQCYLRYILYEILRSNSKTSFVTIGKALNRGHSAVGIGHKKFDYLILTDKKYAKIYKECQAHILNFIDTPENKMDGLTRPVLYRYIRMLKNGMENKNKFNNNLKSV